MSSAETPRDAPLADVGVVVIGRNEGERLRRCLRSVVGRAARIVYVDSGSRDESVAFARSLGVDVVELDPGRPFTAARARNEGFARLAAGGDALPYVQFLDGDCELAPGWLGAAREHLERHGDVAVACGRRRERRPGASPYNRLADLEWNTPVGDAAACGGDALMRASVFRAIGGYREEMIAGEDPELCFRIRRAGHRISRLDREMTLHDAALERFGQWWRRAARGGHACAEAAALHRSSGQRYRLRELLSISAWGGLLPVAALGLAWPSHGLSLAAALLAYAWLWGRIYRHRRQRRDPPGDAALYASALVVAKLAEMGGVLRYAWSRVAGHRRGELIEYK